MSNNLLENLNKEQLQAAMHKEGPLMIIAGAGTGKTTVITQRIAWLIEQGLAKPDEILALTFTEKSATEMEERVDRLLPMGYLDLWISTFHSFCERILREHALEIGLSHEFTLLDEVDTMLLMRRNFDKFDLDYYRPRGNPTRFVKALLQHFSRIKDEMISPELYLEYVEKMQMDADTFEGVASEDEGEKLAEIARVKEVAGAYHEYQQILLENNAMDFADLIAYTLELFKKRPNILKMYREQFKFILVDEFQDTNTAQYELVKLLSAPKNNLTVVGDDDQSIYKFRGASLGNIMQFSQDFPNASRVVLTKNYRSAKQILDSAYTLIQQNNPHRLEIKEQISKALEAQLSEDGEVLQIECEDEISEVRSVIEKIAKLRKSEVNWGDIAILVRANSTAEPFVNAFTQVGIPFRFLAMSGLYTKPIVLDILSWMRVVDQPHDSPSFYRILSQPELGIESHEIAQITHYCRRKGLSIFDAVRLHSTIPGLGIEAGDRLREILKILSELETLAKRLPIGEFFVSVAKTTGLLGCVAHVNEAQQQELYDLMQQFYKRCKRFESSNDDKTLHHFLAEFDHERDAGEVGGLSTDTQAGPDVVSIMTVHASKGLEFPYVFMVGMVEQRFPSQQRGEAISVPEDLAPAMDSGKEAHLAEERRLCYVAMTRAKKGLYLYYALDYGGARKRKPSRFLQEVGIDNLSKWAGQQADVQENVKKDTKAKYKIPNALSFTQIAAFSNCPMQYKFAHILKVPVFGRHSLSFGKTMHNSLQKFMEAILAMQTKPQASLFEEGKKDDLVVPSKKELLQIFENAWIDEWYPDEKIKKEYFEKGKE
ncbi:ATP-dependent helicase, partial [Patescibacteria group bacterium]|nr:ATP-dependent helicase [Patescibacteria group bacterium]